MSSKRKENWRHGDRRPQFHYNRRIESILQEISTEKGRRAESLADNALSSIPLPKWVLGHESHPPNSTMDKLGIDLTVKTDRGAVSVQIKSSLRGVKDFKSDQEKGLYANDIVVVILNPSEPFTRIAHKILHRVGERRALMPRMTAQPR